MRTDQKATLAATFPVHVGVDTGKTFHVLVARGPDGMRKTAQKVPVGRAGFEAADQYLTSTFPQAPRDRMLVGVEFAGHHGFTFANFLAQRGYTVVSVLPAHTKRIKDAEDNTPLKTDAKDARTIGTLLSLGLWVGFPLLSTPYVELRVLTVHRQRLTAEATRFANRLQGLLDLAWPEFLSLTSPLSKKTPWALLERWPVPEDLLAASPRTVAAYLWKVSRGKFDAERTKALLTATKTSVALPQATAERRLEIRHLLARRSLVRQQIAEVEARIAAHVSECPTARALLTVPQVSVVCAATLVAEIGDPGYYEHYRQILKLAGMSLYEKSSALHTGRKRMTKRGRPALRRQLFLLAGRWCQPRGLYREDYLAMLARGKSRTSAVCALSRRLVPMLFQLMRAGEPFELARWQANRLRKEAPAITK